MGKLQRTIGLPVTQRGLYAQIETMARTLDSQINFGLDMTNTGHSNVDIWKASGACPGVANTQFTVNHNLGHIPFFFFWFTTLGGVVYASNQAGWTAATNAAQGSIFLKCTVASDTYNVMIL